jgi:2-phosphoglycerate kinase
LGVGGQKRKVTPPIDLTALDAHKKKEIKSERILLDSVKDHLIPHLSKNKMAKEMFDASISLC